MRTTIPTLCKPTWINPLLLLIALMALSGCATSGTAIPQGGPTMAQVYEDAMQQSNGDTLDQARTQVQQQIPADVTPQLSDYTRTSENETTNLFPLLPDPQLVMYVTPHLAGNEMPVPGYATAFPLYTQLHYALPGEVPTASHE